MSAGLENAQAIGTPPNPYLAYPGVPGCSAVRDSGYGDSAEIEGGPSKLRGGGGGAVDGTRRDHALAPVSKSKTRAEYLGRGSVSFPTDLMYVLAELTDTAGRTRSCIGRNQL